jgi:hypothetical protein
MHRIIVQLQHSIFQMLTANLLFTTRPWHGAGLVWESRTFNFVNKSMKLKRNAAILSVALALAVASVSQATPMLRVSDGVTTITIADGAGTDLNLAVGAVTFSGAINGWSILVTSGATKPVLGSATDPHLDLTWQVTHTSSAGGANLTICFSENGFNLATPTTMVADIGGTAGPAGNTVNVRTFYDLGNLELATTTALTTHLFTSPPNGFSGSDVGGPVGPDPSVAFTIKLVLSQAIGSVSSGDIDLHTVGVPEGGSMVTFLGTGLLALGVFAARRKVARA